MKMPCSSRSSVSPLFTSAFRAIAALSALLPNLKVVAARGLPKMDTQGLADPYVTLTVGQHSAKTSVRPNTLDPEWNEMLSVELDPGDVQSYATVTIYDADAFNTSEVIGSIFIPLACSEVCFSCMCFVGLLRMRVVFVLFVFISLTAVAHRGDLFARWPSGAAGSASAAATKRARSPASSNSRFSSATPLPSPPLV